MDKSKALTWSELRVGVVTIVSLVILAFTILYVGGAGGSPFAHRYVVKALMSDVNGLKQGAPVRVGGVEVGTVTRVDFAPQGAEGMVELSMRLDARVKGRVTTESRATLGSLGLLGEKAVDISGASTGQPVEDGGFIAADSEDSFKGLLSDASESTAHMKRILSRMDAGEGLLGKALRDDELYRRMTDVSVRLQGLMGKLESEQGPLGRLLNDDQMSRRLASSIAGIETVVGRLDAGQGTLGVLSKDDQLAADLKSVVSGLNDLTGSLGRGEGAAGHLLHDDAFFKKLDGVVDRLDATLGRLDSGEGSVARALREPELYNNMNGTLKDVRGLLADFKRDPKRYLRVKISLF
jgi:phospholipid/cholesterol/gamma-HCH transport system substrate-binding protein